MLPSLQQLSLNNEPPIPLMPYKDVADPAAALGTLRIVGQETLREQLTAILQKSPKNTDLRMIIDTCIEFNTHVLYELWCHMPLELLPHAAQYTGTCQAAPTKPYKRQKTARPCAESAHTKVLALADNICAYMNAESASTQRVAADRRGPSIATRICSQYSQSIMDKFTARLSNIHELSELASKMETTPLEQIKKQLDVNLEHTFDAEWTWHTLTAQRKPKFRTGRTAGSILYNKALRLRALQRGSHVQVAGSTLQIPTTLAGSAYSCNGMAPTTSAYVAMPTKMADRLELDHVLPVNALYWSQKILEVGDVAEDAVGTIWASRSDNLTKGAQSIGHFSGSDDGMRRLALAKDRFPMYMPSSSAGFTLDKKCSVAATYAATVMLAVPIKFRTPALHAEFTYAHDDTLLLTKDFKTLLYGNETAADSTHAAAAREWRQAMSLAHWASTNSRYNPFMASSLADATTASEAEPKEQAVFKEARTHFEWLLARRFAGKCHMSNILDAAIAAVFATGAEVRHALQDRKKQVDTLQAAAVATTHISELRVCISQLQEPLHQTCRVRLASKMQQYQSYD